MRQTFSYMIFIPAIDNTPGALYIQSIGIYAINGRFSGMFTLPYGEVKIKLIYRNLHFPRVILLGTSEKRLSEKEAANPKHNRLAILQPVQK